MMHSNLNSLDSKIHMTDYLFLVSIWFVVWWAVDPLHWGLDRLAHGMKHFPLISMLPALSLAYVGGALFKNKRNSVAKQNPNNKPMLIIWLFAIFITIGSLYARFIKGIDNGFLTMGLYAMGAPVTAWFINQSQHKLFIIKSISYILLFWALVSVAIQFANFRGVSVFHEKEHLALASVSILYFISSSKIIKVFVVGFIIISAISANKNTAYIIALLLILFFSIISGAIYASKLKDRFSRWFFWFQSTFVLTAGVGVAGLLYLYLKSDLPSGNPEYRLHTYEIAWNKFLNSPIWGNGFTRAATEEFDLFTVNLNTQILPTHSDPLDIIANGGLIAFSLWISIFFILSFRWYALIFHPEKQEEPDLVPYLHTLFCLAFSGLFVCLFNPILNAPNKAFVYWIPIGILISFVSPTQKKEKRKTMYF